MSFQVKRYIRIVNSSGNTQNNQMSIIDVMIDGNAPYLLAVHCRQVCWREIAHNSI
jgi:hypothetical protein